MALISPRSHGSPAYVACHSDRSGAAVDTLMGRDRDYLRLTLTYSPAEITSSGLDKQIAAAEKRLQTKLDQAHDLFAPLGLSREELQSAVFHILRKETPK